MAGVLLFFIDGLGIPPGPVFDCSRLFCGCVKDYPRDLPGGGTAVAIDPCLGIPGLPQSATGQTALVTGVNAPAVMGKHVSGFPGPTLKALIKRKGLFRRLQDKGIPRGALCFANAFRPQFFTRPPSRVSVSTFHALSAGLPLATLEDLARGEALYHDFTNTFLVRQGYSLSTLTPREAGERLARLARVRSFTFYEYFLTDLAGHKRDKEMALSILESLDAMIFSLLEHLPLDEVTLVVTSDHGNMEDLERRPHTKNPVPLMVWGRGKEKALGVKAVHEVAHMVEVLLEGPLTSRQCPPR